MYSFMNTMIAAKDVVSLRGFKLHQVFPTEFDHVSVVPMEDKTGKSIAPVIKRCFKGKGVSEHLMCG